MAYTTRSTVNGLACEELHIRILWYQNDQRRNLYIELQKLNQRAARNKEFL